MIGRHVSRHAKEAAAVAIQLPIAALYAALALAHVVLAMLLKVIARLPSLTRQLRHAEWLPVTEWLPAMRQSLPSSAADALRGAAGSPLQLSTPVRAVRDGARVAADAAGTHTALLMRAVGVAPAAAADARGAESAGATAAAVATPTPAPPAAASSELPPPASASRKPLGKGTSVALGLYADVTPSGANAALNQV